MDEFTYVIDLTRAFPPHGKPQPPFGPSAVEIMRSCPLRSRFDASSSCERRTDFSTRVGTAFHRAVQSLAQDRPASGASTEQVAEEARSRFRLELNRQLQEAAQRPRERALAHDASRIAAAEEAVIVEAIRIQASPGPAFRRTGGGEGAGSAAAPLQRTLDGGIEVEVTVQSADGLFRGRIDRVEPVDGGYRLIDYKATLRSDLPARYERQLQLYALMWRDATGAWPVEALILYPLKGASHTVDITPALCEQAAAEAASLIAQVQNETSPARLAAPGDVCKVCDCRPWCQPFWDWQNQERSAVVALERGTLGFEGEIRRLESIDHFWRVTVAWRSGAVELAAPHERFPQLQQAQTGMKVRVLDAQLKGLRTQPKATVRDSTELFVIT